MNIAGYRAFVAVLVGVLALSVALSVEVLVTRGGPEGLLCLVSAVALGFLFLTVLLRRDYDIGEPLSFVILAVAVGVTLKAPYLILASGAHGTDEGVRFLLFRGEEPTFLLGAATLAAVGMLLLGLGYLLPGPRLRVERWRLLRETEWDTGRIALFVGLCATISLISMVLYVQKMGIAHILADVSKKRFYVIEGGAYESSALGYYRWGASLMQPALLVLLAWHLRSGRPFLSFSGLALVPLGLAAVAFPVFNSSRTGATLVFLNALIVAYYVRGRQLKFRSVAAVLALLVAVFLVTTALRPNRNQLDAIQEHFGFEPLVQNTVGSRHFLDLTKTAYIIDAVPEAIPYQYGRTFFTWAVMPIPRTMWPQKPTLGSGPLLGPVVFNTTGAGVPPGVVAEMYLNFGVFGVVFGMLVVGMILRALYRTFEPVRGSPNAVLVYSVVLIVASFGMITGDFSRAVVQSLTALIPIVIALRFITPRRTAVAA